MARKKSVKKSGKKKIKNIRQTDLSIHNKLSELHNEVTLLTLLLPPDGFISTKEITKAHIEYGQNLLNRTRQLCIDLGMDVDRTISIEREEIPIFDFELPSYDEFESEYNRRVKLHRKNGTFAGVMTNVPYTILASGGGSIFIPWWLEKLLNLLGIDDDDIQDFAQSFVEEITEELFEKMKKASAERKWITLGDLIEKALEKIRSSGTFLERLTKKLARRIGATAAAKKAAKILARIGSKFIPFLGWAIFILELLWYLTENLLKLLK